MANFIIIGGSKSHLPFIEAARKLGYSTVVFDQNPDCPGAQEADFFSPISTHDLDSISTTIKKLNRYHTTKGIITYSSSSEPLLITAKLCEMLYLPSFSVESVELAIDKTKMKKQFIHSNVPTPSFRTVSSLKEAKDAICLISPPWIIKPRTGSQGSSGLSLLRDANNLEECYNSASRISSDGCVLIEQYYEGHEFSVDGIVIDQKPTILAVSQKYNLGAEKNFTISGFATDPILDKDINKKAITEVALSAVKAMKINNSYFSVDVRLTDHGPFVLECGVLLDAKIDRLLYFAGVDVYELICKVASGENINLMLTELHKSYALKFMFASKQGKLKIEHRSDTNTNINNNRTLIEWERYDGELVCFPKSIADTIGWVITEGNDYRQAYSKAIKICEEANYKII